MRNFIMCAVFLLSVLNANGQCRYCSTYEDFCKDKWETLDSVSCKEHSKGRQIWIGGNDFTLKTGNGETDKMLKKNALLVQISDTMYVNCRNLIFEKMRFGNGYTVAYRLGEHDLLFVNKIIGAEVRDQLATAGFALGAIGGAMVASEMVKQQVCYIITNGADKKGRIAIQLVNDDLMRKLLVDQPKIYTEYIMQRDSSKRMLASHILPLLEKAGLLVLPHKEDVVNL